MKSRFIYSTFAAVCFSAMFLGPDLLPVARTLGKTGDHYPIRMKLPQRNPSLGDSFPSNSDWQDRAEQSGNPERSNANGIEFPADGPFTKEMQAESFAASFRNIGLTAPQPRGPRSLGDVLPVQYDLGTQTGSSAAMAVQSTRALAGTIDVRKQIRVGKAAAAPIDMKVGSGANLYVNVAQLSSMLKTQGKVLEAPSGSDPDGFVSLDSLRNSGFKVRYDAAGDAIVIDGDG